MGGTPRPALRGHLCTPRSPPPVQKAPLALGRRPPGLGARTGLGLGDCWSGVGYTEGENVGWGPKFRGQVGGGLRGRRGRECAPPPAGRWGPPNPTFPIPPRPQAGGAGSPVSMVPPPAPRPVTSLRVTTLPSNELSSSGNRSASFAVATRKAARSPLGAREVTSRWSWCRGRLYYRDRSCGFVFSPPPPRLLRFCSVYSCLIVALATHLGVTH